MSGGSKVPETSAVNRTTLATQIEDQLRLDIVMGIWQPGERLRSQELERRYQVSATPLREALRRLAAMGMVELEANFGARVAPMSLAEMYDIYDIRIELESRAIAESIRSGDDAWRQSVEESAKRLHRATVQLGERAEQAEVSQWSRIHHEFHLALISACRSTWTLRFIEILYGHSERYWMVTAWGGKIRRDVLSEHDHLCQCALTRDADGAVAAIREHLERTVELLRPAFEKRAAT